MSSTVKNSLLISAVILLTCIPLLTVKSPLPDPAGQNVAIFTGADTQAKGIIQKINPDYQPWFNSLFTPPSVEIESLLFALQAAIGAGIIGYYAGFVRGRKKGEKPPVNEIDRRAH